MASWADLYDPDLLAEIQRGLVLHLDPDRLLNEGATCTVNAFDRVQGQHFFLCLSVTREQSDWTPLFTNATADRIALPTAGRYGHPKWQAGVFHFYPGQIWSASAQGLANAAARAHDKSRSGSRNGIDPARIPHV